MFLDICILQGSVAT